MQAMTALMRNEIINKKMCMRFRWSIVKRGIEGVGRGKCPLHYLCGAKINISAETAKRFGGNVEMSSMLMPGMH